MKLKSMLMLILLALTIIPITIVTLLLYKSGFELSKESYNRNLAESLNVQANYMAQTLESNMITDYRFASQTIAAQLKAGDAATANDSLFPAFTSYLNTAEDKITVCVLLNQQNEPVYAIGEKAMIDAIDAQLSNPEAFTSQAIKEFAWSDGTYSLGIVTPVWEGNTYMGCLISVYDKSYLFKVISSYYEITDTSTYICRQNGEVISSRSSSTEESAVTEQVLNSLTLDEEGTIGSHTQNTATTGYYKNIYNTPWYLAGFVDEALIYSFTNQFIVVYILIILGVLLVDILLAFYFSRRVVKPINNLIGLMEGYQHNLTGEELACEDEGDYYETSYLRAKFSELMGKILLIQHNFQGVYQLYESGDMSDTNIDIDVKKQTISSNKDSFQALMNSVKVPEGACIVETFTYCFCEKDQQLLMDLFTKMRDEHLSSMQEAEVYTPYLEQKWFHTLVVPMYENDRLSRLFVQLRDISGFKKQEQEAHAQTKRDVLTGLCNRAGFIANVDSILQAGTATEMHGLLFIDIDYFKLVNDNFGHAAGDDLLRTVSKTLLELTRPDDIVSRFGGDEFAVFLPYTGEDAVAKIQQRLKENLVYPFKTEQTSFVVSASIGASIWRHDSPDTLEHLLQHADAAMYQSKRAFKAGK